MSLDEVRSDPERTFGFWFARASLSLRIQLFQIHQTWIYRLADLKSMACPEVLGQLLRVTRHPPGNKIFA